MGLFSDIGKIPELTRRIIVTALLLGVYRVGVFVPTPGIDGDALSAFFSRQRERSWMSLRCLPEVR